LEAMCRLACAAIRRLYRDPKGGHSTVMSLIPFAGSQSNWIATDLSNPLGSRTTAATTTETTTQAVIKTTRRRPLFFRLGWCKRITCLQSHDSTHRRSDIHTSCPGRNKTSPCAVAHGDQTSNNESYVVGPRSFVWSGCPPQPLHPERVPGIQ
jgi:hypothetical protein